MKNKKYLFISLLILAIGFAVVSTVLYINGDTTLATNVDNFDVYFSGAILDGEDKTNLFVKDKKHIVYKTNDLMKAGDISELEYEVTNGSNQYDADVEITCTPTTTDYYTVTTVPNELTVEAGKVENGKIKVELLKYSTEIIEETIECELVANAVERTNTGDDVATIGDYAIEGILKDKDGNIMPKTNIVIYSNTPHKLRTDRNGYFYVEGLEKGIHEIYLDNGEDVTDKEAVAASSECAMTLSTNDVYKVTKGKCSIDSHDAGLELEDKSIRCEYALGNNIDFDYTGSEQEFIVPEGCAGTYKIELWGASGGYNDEAYDASYTAGNIELDDLNKLYVYVGQRGFFRVGPNVTFANTPLAFNGGGKGNRQCGDGSSYGGIYVAGGATDVRTINGTWSNKASLSSRIMVAAASGGQSGNGPLGGTGGGLTGYNGKSHTYGYGATQTSAGNVNGSFGIGGNANWTVVACNMDSGNGGGGGWYGGGGATLKGQNTYASGGSGSSYISGHAGCIGVNSQTDITPKCSANSTSVECSQSWTGLSFTNTVMIDGAGYNWTTIKGEQVGQPQPDGTTKTGHNGNGYARITYLG